jgi:hypothetical protein
MKRLIIYPKDIQLITGKSERQSRNSIMLIKKKLNKDKHQLVTVEEFCNYMGLDVEVIQKMIK